MIALQSLKQKTKLLIKKGKNTMKKTAFIITTMFCTLTLFGCGEENSNVTSGTTSPIICEADQNRLKSLQTEIESMEDKLNEGRSSIEDKIDEGYGSIEDKIDEGYGSIEDKLDIIIANLNSEGSKEPPVTQTPAPETQTSQSVISPTVTVSYGNDFLAIPTTTDRTVEPFVLPYSGKNRDLNVIVSGSVSKINLIDSDCNYLSKIDYKKVNGMACFYFYMETDGSDAGAKFYFEITTDNNQQYRFGVDYHVH